MYKSLARRCLAAARAARGLSSETHRAKRAAFYFKKYGECKIRPQILCLLKLNLNFVWFNQSSTCAIRINIWDKAVFLMTALTFVAASPASRALRARDTVR